MSRTKELAGRLASTFTVLLAGTSCFLDLRGSGAIIDDGDRDRDTVLNYVDNCIDVVNMAQADFDGDTVGNACQPGDSDQDGDGVNDRIDWCFSPDKSSPSDRTNMDCQGGVTDWLDGVSVTLSECNSPESPDDIHGDSINDHCDNCPLIVNRFQENDGEDSLDDVGNACEDPRGYSLLRIRMTRVAIYDDETRSDVRKFNLPWIETFNDDVWQSKGPFAWTDGSLYYPASDVDIDVQGFSIVPESYELRLRNATNHGAMAMLQFREDPSLINDREATAGIIMKVDYDGTDVRSWAYCGLGRSVDGEVTRDVLITKIRDAGCTDAVCESGRVDKVAPLPDGAALAGGGLDPPYYVLQAVTDYNTLHCYLRNRVYHGSFDGDVIAGISTTIAPLSEAVVGLRAQGISVAFKAVALFRD
jgi:hypothetical protein